MDIWVFLGLIVLAIPLAGVAGLVFALQARGRIETLEKRLVTVERELARRAAEAPRPATEQTPAPSPAAVSRPAPPASPQPAPAASKSALPPSAARAPVPSQPKPASRSLEELIGARWSVIVGGVALALGGIFLVRYSIEQGWLGPAARVTFGALFSAALLILAERMRRAEAKRGTPRRAIDIPAVLTSAGAVSAFGTVYAAYALYGFLSPAAAFVALGLVALATLVAAALHGPIVGAVGLIGAHAAPLLISSEEPNAWALYIYLLAPTAAAFAVARRRSWPGLAVAAGVAAFLWAGLAVIGVAPADAAVLLVYSAALIALAAFMHSGGRLQAPELPEIDPISSGLIGLFGLIAAVCPAIDGFGQAALGATGGILAAMLALAVWASGLAPVAAVGAGLAALVALSFDDQALAAVAEITSFPAPGETAHSAGVESFLVFSGALGAIYLLGGSFAARLKPALPAWRTGLLAASSVAAPLALMAIAYWRVSAFAPDLRFAGLTVLLALAFTWLTEDAARREAKGAASPMVTASYAVGAAAALGLALAMAMREGALTVALSFLAMALGFVAVKRPIRALGWLAIAACAIVLARIAIDPRIVGDGLGTTPIFNASLWGYGAPAAAFWLGSRQFDKVGQTLAANVLEALSLVFALLLGFCQARHLAHGGDMTAPSVKLVEAGLDATVAFALAAVAGRVGLGRASPPLKWGALILGAIGVAASLAGLLVGANPVFSGEPVSGGLLINDLLPGYLVPAVAAFMAARFAAEGRPAWMRRALGAAALALAFAWVTLLVRRYFQGPDLSGPDAGDAEWYAYSLVWLVFGLALLAAGVARRSQMLRAGSALVIVAVSLKVFLFDLAGLDGVWRALSFIGLGGVLICVGLVYQRLLMPKPAPA
ncbi:DUF2339 domain-containing protein [Chelatococcus sambhunathii]|uniref:DUF2339 domain-containing protein n=1 Tax=Chelatococcus sambhunathii TaxID=363953 RepID=A0ABU1DII8_9HYPH|nr:DUF2339 domain-containing protein [Chelatococcus sambhunathii]MDR4307946.1 DUF2339 domain-containing protein [Chelatococcus sambhunathii]